MLRLLSIVLVGLPLGQALEATSEVWGQMIESTEAYDMNAIMSCFHGIGMKTCTYDETASSEGMEVDLSGMFADFSWDSVFTGDKLYCMECCSNRRLSHDVDETIAVKCDLTDPRATYNGRSKTLDLIKASDWEFRFARRQTTTDDVVVTCPLNRTDPTAYVIGYSLTLWITEYDQVLGYWRGVDKCEAIAIETNDNNVIATKMFTEKTRLIVGSSARNSVVLFPLFLVYYLVI